LVSHGCVRLEKPRELAALLLVGQGDWSSDLIAAKIE
jgi:murein L,D-transpeptidase YcbB/YkuD